MSQYKVLQDIEAEDKLLGPLSLRQFIYAVIVVVLGFVAWRLLMVQWFLVIPFLPPIVFFALLAAPFGREQSSEVWMLAKVRYFIFPRRRIWSQDGIQNLVTITAPKIEHKNVTKDFDKDEAQSRLKALAATMDTRGWAIRNVSTNGYQNPFTQNESSDRLLELQTTPDESLLSVKPSDDVLDSNTPLAQTMGSLQAQSQQAHRQAILQKMQTLAAQQKHATPVQPAPQPVPTPVAAAPVAPAAPSRVQIVQEPVTPPPTPAILKEVKSPQSATELRVNETSSNSGDDADEVVVSLH